MLPLLPGSSTSVRIQDVDIDGAWKAVENKRSLTLVDNGSISNVRFEYFGGRKRGMLDALVVDLSEVGKIYIIPVFNSDTEPPRKYTLFDALHSSSQADPQRVTLRYVVSDKAKLNEEKQAGLEVLEDENLTQLVNVAQMMVCQRLVATFDARY